MIEIIRVEHFEPELLKGIQNLFPQLTQFSPIPEEDQLRQIINSGSTTIWVAIDDDRTILGMLNLAIYRTTTGLHAWIEDVVVDQAARRNGIAAQLTQSAIDYAKHKGAKEVNLTSRPAREAANFLYQKLGFSKVETNLYRMTLD